MLDLLNSKMLLIESMEGCFHRQRATSKSGDSTETTNAEAAKISITHRSITKMTSRQIKTYQVTTTRTCRSSASKKRKKKTSVVKSLNLL